MLDVPHLFEEERTEGTERVVFLPKFFVVKIGFDGDVGDGRVECSLEDIK